MADVIRNESEGMTTFDITDFGLAAALMSLGHELIAMHPMEDCQCTVFHFVTTTLVKQDAQAYCNGKLSVNVKQYDKAHEYIENYFYGELHDED